MTIEHHRSLWHGLELSNSFEIALFAVACMAFWCCCRLGELTDPHFEPTSHVAHSTEFKHGIAANGLKYINFHVLHPKTKEAGKDINVIDFMCPCSATSALEHHLSSNKDVPVSAPLFAFESADGQWAPMKQTWFMARCNTVWEKDGLASIKGHGF